MVAHRRQDECQLALVVRDVGRLVGDLHHQQHRCRGVGAVERRQVERQLVAEDGDEDGHRAALAVARVWPEAACRRSHCSFVIPAFAGMTGGPFYRSMQKVMLLGRDGSSLSPSVSRRCVVSVTV